MNGEGMTERKPAPWPVELGWIVDALEPSTLQLKKAGRLLLSAAPLPTLKGAIEMDVRTWNQLRLLPQLAQSYSHNGLVLSFAQRLRPLAFPAPQSMPQQSVSRMTVSIELLV